MRPQKRRVALRGIYGATALRESDGFKKKMLNRMRHISRAREHHVTQGRVCCDRREGCDETERERERKGLM